MFNISLGRIESLLNIDIRMNREREFLQIHFSFFITN